MKDYSSFIIPRTLDYPEKILFFTYPELGILMLPTIIGIATGAQLKGVIAGIILLLLIKKINPKNKGFNLIHMIYWYAPSWLFKTEVLPLSEYRVFLG